MKIDRLAPSRAHRWFPCPGSVRAEKYAPPSPEREWSKEGSAAHRLFELCLSKQHEAEIYVDDTITWDKGKSSWVVTEDMAEHIQSGIDLVNEYRGKAKVYTEQTVPLRVAGTNTGGTIDAWWHGQYAKEWQLHVLDLKYGQGAFTDAEDNKQLYIYALAVLAKLKKQVDKVHLWIYQPRVKDGDGLPYRHIILDPYDLIVEFKQELEQHVQAALSPRAPLNAGSHCLYCAAHAVCPKAEEAAFKTLRMKFERHDRDRVGELKFRIPMLKEFIKAVEGLATVMADADKPPTGWHYVTSNRTYRKWKGGGKGKEDILRKKMVPILKSKFKLKEDDVAPRKLVSFPKVDKMVPKDRRDELKKYMERTHGRKVLVPVDDKRYVPAAHNMDFFSDDDDDSLVD